MVVVGATLEWRDMANDPIKDSAEARVRYERIKDEWGEGSPTTEFIAQDRVVDVDHRTTITLNSRGYVPANQTEQQKKRTFVDTVPFLVDSFNAPEGTLLENHLSDSGHSWTNFLVGGNFGQISVSNRKDLFSSSVRNTQYYNSAVPRTADYIVQAIITPRSLSGIVGIVGRFSPVNGECYLGRYNVTTGGWEIFRLVTPSQLRLALVPAILTVGQEYHMALKLRGSRISLIVNGSEIAAVDDANITSKGLVGVRSTPGTPPPDSNTLGLHLKELSAHSINY